ncbi:hypothetical protein CMUS01_11448 [Colletotrichum musicola]|uniref:Uncharacterized protein n=1 Tax=Colletotrichum musicola TaxID=2175873 RepID=A0A8H6N5P5_9PEZI|nr:hypothetical protein CMUS01_11448 [Colletotrichum musicola]
MGSSELDSGRWPGYTLIARCRFEPMTPKVSPEPAEIARIQINNSNNSDTGNDDDDDDDDDDDGERGNCRGGMELTDWSRNGGAA